MASIFKKDISATSSGISFGINHLPIFDIAYVAIESDYIVAYFEMHIQKCHYKESELHPRFHYTVRRFSCSVPPFPISLYLSVF